MNDPTPAKTGYRMRSLVRKLEGCGALQTTEWADAFATVPRHLFVPRWYEQSVNERGIAVWNERDHTDEDAWLSAVYSDTTLVTALDPATAERTGERAWSGVATSSSTQPGLMARMLEALSVHGGGRVLEIGTGTGYNAALLCARLGSQLVHSIDVDPGLVEAAGKRLARLGYTPHLRIGDGQAGAPDSAPFPRIIATCSVPRVPQAWVDQLAAPQGVLLTDLDLGIEGGLVRFTPQRDGELYGSFTRATGRFMPARQDALTYAPPERAPYAPEEETRPTAVTAADIRGDYAFRLVLAFTLPRAPSWSTTSTTTAPRASSSRPPTARGPAPPCPTPGRSPTAVTAGCGSRSKRRGAGGAHSLVSITSTSPSHAPPTAT